MMDQIIVHKGRTTIVQLKLGWDVSNDIITSEVRIDKDPDSDLIAAWDVSFATDGTDGELILKMDDSVTSEITKSVGYMDIKRLAGGEPLNVLDEPLEVFFKNVVTV